MLNDVEKRQIRELAEKYNVQKIFVFGSASMEGNDRYNDIDLGVDGLDASLFFSFYSELMRSLDKPIDLVDMSIDTRFTRLIRAESVAVYG